MQEESARRTNKQRTEATRKALIKAARKLFVTKGYAETGTPEIVKAAKVTRGALYHHFADKADLFRAVIRQEAEAVSLHISKSADEPKSAMDGLITGANAYFEAMAAPGRVRLLLLDGPAVLGHGEMRRIDQETGGEELRLGLASALAGKRVSKASLDAMTDLLSAAFDRAALAVADGSPAKEYRAAIRTLLTSVVS